MTTYVALLRGINVSGQKLIKMDRLRSVFESMSFRQVQTYIQSGNVVFEAEEQATRELGRTIEARLLQEFGFEVAVVVRTIAELEALVQHHPFEKELAQEEGKLYLTLLAEAPQAEAIANLESVQNDVDSFHVGDREVYILCRESYGKSQFSNHFLEKKLKVKATTRNWQTMNKLLEMGRQ